MRLAPWLGIAITSALACGTSVQPGVDAGGVPGMDATAGTAATVRVVDDGVPVSGAQVVFHNSAGEVVGFVVADDTGTAVHQLPADGMVTVAYPNEITLAVSRIQLLTFTDVDPGDELTVEIPRYSSVYTPPDKGPIIGSIRVEIPPLANAGYYVVHLGCDDVTTDQLVTVIDVPETCLGSDDKLDITVDAFTPPDLPSWLGTTFATRVPVAFDTVTDITLPAWAIPHPTIDIQLTDFPDGATNAFAIPVMIADGMPFAPFMADTAALTGKSVTMSPGFLPAFADSMDLEVRINAEVANRTALYLLRVPVDQTTTVSGTSFLPTVRDVAVNGTGGEISWTATGALANADATFLHLRSERREGIVTRLRRWTVTTPATTASPFTLPTLPPELASYRPLPGDDYLDSGIVTFDVDWIDGYESFIADHGTKFLDDPCVPTYSTARMTNTGVFYGPQLTSRAY